MSDPKRAYATRQRQTRDHECHWPDCDKQVPPAMWGCKPHWFALPKRLRDRIWDAYVPGQERRMNPSDEYLDAAMEVMRWIDDYQAAAASSGIEEHRP